MIWTRSVLWKNKKKQRKNPKNMVCFFKLQEKKRQDSFKHHVHIFLTAEPTAMMYLYRNLLIAKNCMVDGRLHELCLSNCGSTIIQLHHFKKRNPCFHLHQGYVLKALFRRCRLSEACPLLDLSKSTLALTSSLRRRGVSEPSPASVRDVQVVLA